MGWEEGVGEEEKMLSVAVRSGRKRRTGELGHKGVRYALALMLAKTRGILTQEHFFFFLI